MRRNTAGKLTRMGVALTGLLGVLATIVVAPTSAKAADTATFRVGQLNILHELTHAQFVHDLNLVASKSDIVGLNEVKNRKTYLQNWADRNGWHFYAPGTGAASQNAMLARKTKFNVVSKNSIFVCDTNPDDVPPPRYTNWVRYENRATGVDVYHIGTHVNSHIDNNGHPYDLPRTDCAEKHFRQIRDLANNKRDFGQVVVTGDLNVDFVADKAVKYVNFPYTVLDERDNSASIPGLRSNYALHGVKGDGTHGNRHIDYVYIWQRLPEYRVLRMTDYAIYEGPYSDHDAVVANFTIDKR